MLEDSNAHRELSRRRWLGAMGVAGTAAFAGCMDEDEESGADPGVEENGDGNEDGQRLNYMRGGELFANLQWNQFGEQHNSSIKTYVDTITANTRSADNEIDGLGFADWNYDIDSRVMTVELRDDITFWNGDNYDAEDLWTFEELLRLQSPESSSYESIEVTGDYTVEFVTKEPRNEEILFRLELTDTFLDFGTDVWTEWLERYQDAPDQAARDEITDELTGWELSTERLIDEGLGTGAYIVDDVTDEYMDLSAHEDHPGHTGNDGPWDPNVDRIRVWYADETGRQDQFIVNERIDYASEGNTWENYEGQLPEYWEQVVYAPLPSRRYKVLINWRNREYLQDLNFRRAMAAAMDYENQGINTNQLHIESQTGMATVHNEQYWDAQTPDEMIDYGLNQDAALADEYLERGGYTREDGTIYDSDGDQLEEMRFLVGGSDWGNLAQSAANQLDEFGFPVDIRGVDRSTKLEVVQENMGEWDLSTETHYAGVTQHPYEFFRTGSFWGWRLGPGGFGPEAATFDQIEGWLEEGRTHSPFNGKPMVFEIPNEVGAEDLGGETKEINVYELVNEIQGPVGEERDREIIQNLSWAWNYMLPDIDCTTAVRDGFGNTQKLEFGEEADLASYYAIAWPKLGLVRSR